MYIISRTLIDILNVFDNIKNFLSSLTAIDIIFFFAVLLLMVLLVALLYFIKTNADYIEPDTSDITNKFESIKEDQVINEISEPENLGLYNSSVISSDNNKESFNYSVSSNGLGDDADEQGELFDLETITKKLENKELNMIDLTEFEEEQEKDAIISYEELLNRAKGNIYSLNNESKERVTNNLNNISYDIPYKNEIMLDDLIVKEVDIKGLENPSNNVKAVSYSEEDAFLSALKQLQEQLR